MLGIKNGYNTAHKFLKASRRNRHINIIHCFIGHLMIARWTVTPQNKMYFINIS